MELYNPANASRDLDRIKADIMPHFEEAVREGKMLSAEFHGYYKNMNLFYAWVDVQDERFGKSTHHYTVLVRNGKLEYQTERVF